MKNIPNTIFLNLGEDLEDFEDFNELGEVTWCADKMVTVTLNINVSLFGMI